MIIIAEKINATLSKAKGIILERNQEALLRLARDQAEAGATFLDVNVGTGQGSSVDEAEAMTWAVETIQKHLEIPLCLDSADPQVLEAGLKARQGRPSLVNSVKAEDKILAAVVPLAAEHQAPLVGLAMDEEGIPTSVEGRVRACLRIVETCARQGLAQDRLYLDPLVLPVSTDTGQGTVTLQTLAALKEQIPQAKTVMGLSNISFMLPGRARLNAAFLHMAVAAGLDAVIGDPLDDNLMTAIRCAEVLTGRDRHCRRYTRAMRAKTK
jgi:5-methyltetrahydrofolate--homocysteine methyltransferase